MYVNRNLLTLLLVLGFFRTASAAEPVPALISLQEAKEVGRAKSSFLKDQSTATETTAVPTADLQQFQHMVGPSLEKSCLACHGPERSEGNLRIDVLNPNLLSGADVDRWREIYNALSNSEMPPEDEPDFALADNERAAIVDWLSGEMNKASAVRRQNSDHSSFRRLTKYEYSYALQDLLGLPYALVNRLPPETASEDGFKNSSAMLQMSSMQFQTYREFGLQALRRATVGSSRPVPVTYIIPMHQQFEAASGRKAKPFNLADDDSVKMRNRTHLLNQETGDGVQTSAGKAKPGAEGVARQAPPTSQTVLVLPRSNEFKLDLDRFLPDEGTMRVRLRAGRTTMKPDEYASLRLIFSAHTSNNANFSQVISQRDVPVTASADAPEFIDFEIQLSDIQRNPFRKLETTFPRRDEFLSIRNVSNSNNRKEPLYVCIDYIEITAPFYEQWPPKTHTAIFFDSENKDDEQLYAREVLGKFMRRVWRRPVRPQELAPFMKLFKKYRSTFSSFEEAMLEVLATTLATPEFLYLTHRVADNTDTGRKEISGVELASRLSFFLWSSIPDDELLSLAEDGQLEEPTVLKAQVERMLADPRSRRFSENFVTQWLGLDGIESTTHVKEESLKDSMREEPIAFFEHVLEHNCSVMDFLHSDYAMINERLAKHYQVSQVFGPHFREVAVKPESHRGGVLASAAVMAMNSDGKDSHPLKRGIWMLERILDDPPPPPPPDVPEVDLTDPEIMKMTLKERIADHRNKPACYSCHAKIDPWGIAFENYDAMGAYRTKIKNKPVDATSELFNKQKLAGLVGLKRYLFMDRQDQFARAMVHKMTAYALGRPLSFGDRADIDSVTAEFRKHEDRLGDLVHLIVNSEIFHTR